MICSDQKASYGLRSVPTLLCTAVQAPGRQEHSQTVMEAASLYLCDRCRALVSRCGYRSALLWLCV